MTSTATEPTSTRSPTIRTTAMPKDTNPSGDIFGGWVLSQMDMAAGICAGQRAQGRVVTAAIDGMQFYRPVKVGDILGVYTTCLLYTSPSPRDRTRSRMPSSA